MAYDEKRARRIRAWATGRRGMTEKKMVGGVAFLCNGKMCCGGLRDERVAPSAINEKRALKRRFDACLARAATL